MWLALSHSGGSSPDSNDCWKIKVRQGASSHDNSLSILHGLLSGPEALLTLMLASHFSVTIQLMVLKTVYELEGYWKGTAVILLFLFQIYEYYLRTHRS